MPFGFQSEADHTSGQDEAGEQNVKHRDPEISGPPYATIKRAHPARRQRLSQPDRGERGQETGEPNDFLLCLHLMKPPWRAPADDKPGFL